MKWFKVYAEATAPCKSGNCTEGHFADFVGYMSGQLLSTEQVEQTARDSLTKMGITVRTMFVFETVEAACKAAARINT